MFTYLFQFFLVAATLGLVVAAIKTYRADRKEAAFQAHVRAHSVAHALIMFRIEIGYYDNRSAKQMKKDFDSKYNELITT